MYLNGDVVPQNFVKALNLFTLAAEGGLKDAQNELGFMYYVGKGVEKDFNKAFQWFEKAAYQGDSLAQFNTGMIWYLGNSDKGVTLLTHMPGLVSLLLQETRGHHDFFSTFSHCSQLMKYPRHNNCPVNCIT